MAKSRILIVDDHAALRAGLRALLEGESDFEIAAEADSGERAIEFCRTQPFDVVVMDVRLPGMQGPEVTRQLVSAGRPVKVVGLSMRDEHDVRQAMLDAGAVAHVSKAEAPDRLIQTIRDCLTNGSADNLAAADGSAAQ